MWVQSLLVMETHGGGLAMVRLVLKYLIYLEHPFGCDLLAYKPIQETQESVLLYTKPEHWLVQNSFVKSDF